MGAWALGVVLVLSVPLIAMQFTSEVDWNAADFIIMGTLMFGTALIYELIAMSVDKRHRLIVGAVLFALLLLTWAELAVGIIGTPFAGS